MVKVEWKEFNLLCIVKSAFVLFDFFFFCSGKFGILAETVFEGKCT